MSHMIKRRLGPLRVSPLGLGCWAIGGPFWEGDNPLGWGEVDDRESIRALHAGMEAGVNFLDTADLYGAGHSERVIAKALKGRRDGMVISTKFGFRFDETSRQVTGASAEPDYIIAACEASLKRLDTDFIDIYHLHINDLEDDKVGAVIDTLERLVEEGKIRHYGWSTDFIEKAALMAGRPGCVAIQHEFNILDPTLDMVAFCERYNVASINRGPLAMGLLSGKYTEGATLEAGDIRGKTPDWIKYFNDGVVSADMAAGFRAIRDILTSAGRTPVQGALAWIWAQSEATLPIPGFRTVAQVVDNAAAMEKGPLTAAQVEEIAGLLGYSKQAQPA